MFSSWRVRQRSRQFDDSDGELDQALLKLIGTPVGVLRFIIHVRDLAADNSSANDK